ELALLIDRLEKKGVSIDLIHNQVYLLKIIFENIKKVYRDIDIDRLIVHTIEDMMENSKCESVPEELKPYWNYIITEEVSLEGVPVYQCLDQKEVFHLGNCNIVPIDIILEKMSALRKSISYKKEECA